MSTLLLAEKYLWYKLFEYSDYSEAILFLGSYLPSVLAISTNQLLMCLDLHSEKPSTFYPLKMLGVNCLLIPTVINLWKHWVSERFLIPRFIIKLFHHYECVWNILVVSAYGIDFRPSSAVIEIVPVYQFHLSYWKVLIKTVWEGRGSHSIPAVLNVKSTISPSLINQQWLNNIVKVRQTILRVQT